MTAVLTRIVAT